MTGPTMEGWMVRYGRRKIGRSYFHKRYFVLESLILAYYKRQPSANEVPIKTLPIDGNCRVEDRGLETHHGHTVYVLSVINKKEPSHRITMAAFNVQDASAWKEALEQVIDQYLNLHTTNGSMTFPPSVCKTQEDPDRDASSSDHDSQGNSGKSQPDDDDDDKKQNHHRNRTVGNESIEDWSRGIDPRWSNLNADAAASARRHWHLVRCQNGLRFFEEVQDGVQAGRCKGMKAVGVVEASCADIFELIMGIDETRYEWDCSFHEARLVQEVDGHTTILYQRLQLDFLPMFLWPRDLCYLRYWRRNDDGSYVILFRSKEHPSCPPEPGCVRAHIESGGFTISPLKSHPNGDPRARVQQLVHIDLKGWGANYLPLCHYHSVIQILNSVAGLREWFAQRDGNCSLPSVPRIPKLGTAKTRKRSALQNVASLPEMPSAGQSNYDESEYDDDDMQFYADSEPNFISKNLNATESVSEPPPVSLDLSMLSGNLGKGDLDNGKNCWSIPDCNNFRVRSKHFLIDRSKTAAGEPLMQLVAVDWFKDIKRIDHVAKRKGCVAQVAGEMGLFTVAFNVQVPAASHYSMIFYFVAPKAPQGSLLQRFVDGDDNFRNSRLKLIPSVPQGSWIVRQSVGTTPCILGKAVDCTYYRGSNYLEVDIDIGSSTVANGVLGLVFGVVSALVVDMAFLIQGNGMEELPERLIGAVRVSRLSLASATTPPEAD
ncbi:protein ENHANCED DISEASE RESISTANCE 2 isoform X3 [Physcomitrium patens]|uniref:START domain-containing protein n=1 Tax=Physcomitrium patens TaxID=3218 RepID=A0A7I4AYS2_PHYPA|nr:protein ENHANCED DISEASE RESISTANCE 2-like isoform X3 [Physcomitrium patens]|eukprot:XP_024396181.1 protein ENHANCED DISEASE RESISTANCE 2-like isoform X3 [Physcomitrella patens]